jgi:hypothetical protein
MPAFGIQAAPAVAKRRSRNQCLSGDKELNLNGIALRFNPFAISNKENEIGLYGDRVTGKRIAVVRQYEAC